MTVRGVLQLAVTVCLAAASAAATRADTILPSLARQEDQARFRVTAFATGLGYSTSMATLADGSLLVATSDGGTDWQANSLVASPRGALVRLVDADGDGVADGPAQTMAADSINRVIVHDGGALLTVSAPVQIAQGLRNAAGMAFDGAGNLWLEDNGIDTEGNPGVSFSADELNRVNAADLGTSVPNFGFADTYVRYSDGQTVGPTEGVTLPVAAFLPVGGRKSEGAVELAFAPASFPTDFTGGLFVPFSGVFNQGGPANDENPVVFVNPQSGSRFHFIDNGVMGHPNGALATEAGLFITDLNPTGRFGDPIGAGGTALTLNGVAADQAGVVYLIAPTVAPVPEPSTWVMAVAALACGGFAMARRTRTRQT